jgi:hypothetical protein
MAQAIQALHDVVEVDVVDVVSLGGIVVGGGVVLLTPPPGGMIGVVPPPAGPAPPPKSPGPPGGGPGGPPPPPPPSGSFPPPVVDGALLVEVELVWFDRGVEMGGGGGGVVEGRVVPIGTIFTALAKQLEADTLFTTRRPRPHLASSVKATEPH